MQKILINAYLRRIGRTTTNKTSNTEHLLHGDHQIFKYGTPTSRDHQIFKATQRGKQQQEEAQ